LRYRPIPTEPFGRTELSMLSGGFVVVVLGT
jgi:hypothetical protein